MAAWVRTRPEQRATPKEMREHWNLSWRFDSGATQLAKRGVRYVSGGGPAAQLPTPPPL